MTNIVVAKKRNIRVSTNATAGVLNSTTPVTLKNTPTVTATRLENLQDIDFSKEVDGAALVYNANTNLYEFQTINANVTDIDGGTF
jgi:hypothetical protein